MFRHLRIQNFKCWQDTGPIPMAPLTLFFGANSSGKSSLGQFLMMLKQTVELADRKAVLFPGTRNSAVQLGSYQDMLFERDVSRKIKFAYSWDLSETLMIKDPLSATTRQGDALAFAATTSLEDRGQLAWTLEEFEYRLLQDASTSSLAIGMKRTSDPTFPYALECQGLDLRAPRSTGRPVKFYGFPDEVAIHQQNAAFVQELQLRHENIFRAISYLGPLRTKPERLYSWSGTEPENVGVTGEGTIAALLAGARRTIDAGAGPQPFAAVIASKLLQMDLIDEFKIDSISPHRQEYDVRVRTKGSRQWVDLADTGFGLSQILPVLVQGFYAPCQSTIIVEQPELHLHPRAQSELADVLIAIIQAQEAGAPRKIQLIVETHSEHLLRRLQRRIAEDKIPQSDVAAYFAHMNQSHAQLEPLAIDDYGNIKNWPKGFFGEEMEDAIQHGKAAVQKRLRQLRDDHGSQK